MVETDNPDHRGVLVCHPRDTAEDLLAEMKNLRESGHYGYGGMLPSSIIDQFGPAAPTIWASVRAGNLVQIVGEPLKGGTKEFLQGPLGFRGIVRDVATKKFVGQVQFRFVSSAPIVAPAVAFQVIHLIVGTQQLRSIDERLAHLQRTVEEIIFRQQGALCGRLYAATECLNDLSNEFLSIGRFTSDMTTRLVIAERDVRTVLAEQEVVVDRFAQRSKQLLSEATGRKPLVEIDQLLRESGDTYIRDAAIATAAARARFMVCRAWIAHDLEHVPGYVETRVAEAARALGACKETTELLEVVGQLQEHAAACADNMNRFTRLMYRRVVNRALENGGSDQASGTSGDSATPSCLIWKDRDGHIQTATVQECVE